MSGAEPSGLAVTRAPGRVGAWVLRGACVLVVAMGWDRAAWLLVSRAGVPRLEWLERMEGIEAIARAVRAGEAGAALGSLAYTLVYGFGRIWVWVLLAAIVVFRGFARSDPARVRGALRRGTMLLITPLAAGALAEGLKFLSRRMRPEYGDGMYRFKSFGGGQSFWDMSGLGLASSHAAVAVAGALMGGLVFPRWRWAFVVLATMCCLSRLAVGAHYLSDVVAGALLGALAHHLLYAWDRHNNAGRAITHVPRRHAD